LLHVKKSFALENFFASVLSGHYIRLAVIEDKCHSEVAWLFNSFGLTTVNTTFFAGN